MRAWLESARPLPCSYTILQVAAVLSSRCLQVIGIITAETERQARAGAQAVQVEYEDLPSIVSIQDAMAAGSFFEVREPAQPVPQRCTP